MSHAAVHAIIFDYGKVLSLPPTHQQWQRYATFFGVDEPTIQKYYWGLRDDYDRAVTDGPEYWRRVGKLNGRSLRTAEVEQLIQWDNDQWTNVNPEMLSLAREQQAKGVRTAILSNMQREMLKFMRGKFDWLDEFDVQMYSCEEGIVKPEPKIYLECCKRLGIEPANSLFLDDKQKNIDGALRAGLQAILFEGDREAVERYLADAKDVIQHS
jgi:putative hydrolase of the HAD superfamily